MSIFGTIDFAIFVLLIAILIVLLVPQLPKFIRKNVVEITGKIAHNKYVWPIIMTLLILLFVESSWKLYKMNDEKNEPNKTMFDFGKLFIAQRNFYLTGSNLIFLLVVWRVRHLLKETFE